MGGTFQGECTKGLDQALRLRVGSRDETKVTRDSDAINRDDLELAC